MAGAVSASSTRLVTPVSASRVCSRPSLERLNPTARFLSIQTAQGLSVQTAQGKAARQFTRKTLCQAHVNENKNGDRSEGLPVTKRDFLAGSAAAAAAVTLTPWGAALADGGFAVDEVTGKSIAVSDILQKAASVDRILVRGLDNNPTYLLVDDGKVADYALRAVCTHMGCTPDWVGEDGKFECPCHGSQYNARGEVVEGPAPENLALVHVKIDGGKVRLDDWNEADFRNGETDPWWI